MPRITPMVTGNCNFQYITNLRFEYPKMRAALRQLFTGPENRFAAEGKPRFLKPTCGMYLFAQGSDDSVKTRPYAHRFKTLIEKFKLGEVIEIQPVANPLHNNRKGILFVWIIDHKACAAWWRKEMKLDVKPEEQ